jgi:hypothetical protein
MWGSPPFEWWQTTLLELVCVCFYAAELCAKHSYGRQVFYQNYVNHTRIAMLLLLLSDMLWTFRFGQFPLSIRAVPAACNYGRLFI